LQGAGYATAAELTNPFLVEQRGWGRGFDHFRNEDLPNASLLLTSRTARADTVTRNARLWLKLNPRAPYFLWVHYLDPHAPYDSPDTPTEVRAGYPAEWDTGLWYWHEHKEEMSAEEVSRYTEFRRAMYAEEVRYADRWVGELLGDLKRSGEYGRSLVIISADHGEEFYEHGGFDHGHSMHEELLWVPLLVKWPEGWSASRDVEQMVGLADLAGTVLEAARGEPMEGMRVGALPMGDSGRGEEVYSEAVLHGPEQTALTTDRYKAIYHPHREAGAVRFEVYDRERDRGERHSLAGERFTAEVRERLMARTESAQSFAARWEAEEGAARAVLDEEAERRLRALGYMGD